MSRLTSSLFTKKKADVELSNPLCGHLDYIDKGLIGGWAGRASSSSATKLDVFVNGAKADTFDTNGDRKDLVAIGFQEKNSCGFLQPINVYPHLVTDANFPNQLSVRFHETGQDLVGSPVDLPQPNIRYHIDRLDASGIHGWIYDANYLELDLALDMYINDRKVARVAVNLDRQDLVAHGHPKARCGFYFNHTEFMEPAQFAIVTACIADSHIAAFKKPLVIEPLGAKVMALTDLAKAARRLAEDSRDPRHEWLLLDLLPKLFEDVRKSRGKALPASLTGGHIRSGAENPGKLDVIIPVYEGLEETLNCIDSVLAAQNEQAYRLIVINDKSPNEALTKELRRHAERHGYTLLENERNLGFVGTVNRGMALHDDADVILLNSDTLVPDGWLDQLLAHAYRDPAVATVTPFSNNATICSYPNFCQDNKLPEGADVSQLNRLFHAANEGQMIDLPTAHGFCMFIKRAALSELGLFDDQKWGRGYGEENDFSLRAEQRGWRNVMALDTFVQHLGAVSFAADSEQFIAKNLAVLNDIYPDYAQKVASFIKQDPVRPFRNSVALAQLQQEVETARVEAPAKGKTMLFISLTFGGGTKVATDDLAKLLKGEGQCVLMLTSPKKGLWRLSSHVSEAQIDYAWPEERDKLVEDLKALDVWHIHFHHTIEFPKEIWELPGALGVEYDVTIHDYFTICPRVNLIDETRRYCGEPPVAACERCIKMNGVHEGARFGLREYGATVAHWRAFHQQRLEEARKVFTPSKDTAQRMSRHFPSLEPTVRPHPEEPFEYRPKPIKKGETINVAFIGAIGVHKGYDYLVGCARHAQKWDLPLHFHVIGYTENDEALAEFDNVTVHGPYQRDDLPEMLEATKCKVAALLSVWPETFGYTLSEATRLGQRVVTVDMGAFKERVNVQYGTRIPLSSSVEDICTALGGANRIADSKSSWLGVSYRNTLGDYYNFEV